MAIGRVPASQLARVNAPPELARRPPPPSGDRIHPADAAIAIRAGRLLPFCNQGHVRHRFHDAVLVATAQMRGHGLLTKREGVFGAWTKVALASP